jgi:MFS family permease
MTSPEHDMDSMNIKTDSHNWRSRNLIVLSLVSFFQDAASELLYPVLPIFLTTTLGAPIAVVGVIEGAAEGVSSLVKIVAGRLADRSRKRRFIGLGYGLAAFAKLILAWATTWQIVLLARVTDRTGKGIRSAPRDALIIEDTDPKFFGRAFGFHRAADTLGAVAGPAIGLLLYQLLDHDIRKMMYFAVVPATISAFLVKFVRERSTVPRTPTQRLHVDGLGRRFWKVTMLMTLFSVVNFTDALLLLRARHLGFSVMATIAVYMLFNASYSLFSYPAGHLSDHMARNKVMAIGIAIFGVTYLSLGLTSSKTLVWLIFILYGGFSAFTDGVGKAWVADVVNKDVRSGALGTFQGLTGVGAIVAGVWAGLAWNQTGQFPLIFAGIVALIIVPFVLMNKSDAEIKPRSSMNQ